MLRFWTTWFPLWASRLVNLVLASSFLNVIYQVYSHHEIVALAERTHLSNSSTLISSENVTNSFVSFAALLLVRVSVSFGRSASSPNSEVRQGYCAESNVHDLKSSGG
jgi:hypothetical protein